tara:strand:- start:6292 stop:6489 length:198 start_codon:yes stop_codon:yes gene_type:complete
MGKSRIIRFLCLICEKEVKGGLDRRDMVTCKCGNIYIDNPDILTIKDWELVKIRCEKRWWNVNEL